MNMQASSHRVLAAAPLAPHRLLFPQFNSRTVGQGVRRHCKTFHSYSCIPALRSSQRTLLQQNFEDHQNLHRHIYYRPYSDKMSFSNADTGNKEADP